jgi:hypothetical protein
MASEPVLLASWPVDGATGVPTDSVFVAMPGPGDYVAMELDGAVLLPAEPAHYGLAIVSPGALAPSTYHVLTIRVFHPMYPGQDLVDEIRFRTGDGPWEMPATLPEIGGIERFEPYYGTAPASCNAQMGAQECLDTGLLRQVMLAVEGADGAVALIGRRDGEDDEARTIRLYAMSPCDRAMLVVPEDLPDADACYQAGVLWPNGEMTWTDARCTGPQPSAEGAYGVGGGCVAGTLQRASGPVALLLGGLFLIFAAVRRRGRSRPALSLVRVVRRSGSNPDPRS